MIGNRFYGPGGREFENLRNWVPLAFPGHVAKLTRAGCAILDGGDLYCTDGLWLSDFDDEVTLEKDPVHVPFVEPVVDYASGGVGVACILGAEGTLMCRGSNYYGLLGLPWPEVEDRTTYDVIPNLPPLKEFKLTYDFTNVCGRTFDGTVLCWGSNGLGLKIVDDPDLQLAFISEPTRIDPGFADVLDYAMSDDSVCVVREGSDAVLCRGFTGTGNCRIERGWHEVSYEHCDPNAP